MSVSAECKVNETSNAAKCNCVDEVDKPNGEVCEGLCEIQFSTTIQIPNRMRTISADTSTDCVLDETPLMFSRSSSLSSLNSVETPHIQDNMSVVSEYSQTASGIISPSELPDSPTQSGSELLNRNQSLIYPRPEPPNLLTCDSPQNALPSNTVFEDGVTSFKEEGTPLQFSRGTSLSRLTVDHELHIVNETSDVRKELNLIQAEKRESNGNIIINNLRSKDLTLPESFAQFHFSEMDEDDDDDILAECINIGMQGCHKRRKLSPKRDRYARYETSSEAGACGDAILRYNTEGTPANASHAGSQCDLSILSFSSDGHGAQLMTALGLSKQTDTTRPVADIDFEDTLSNLSEDCEDILAECIRSGMPKGRAP